MRKLFTLFVAVTAMLGMAFGGVAFAAHGSTGPSGSHECSADNDDCDDQIDEDPVDEIDNDGDGAVDEDPPGDAADNPGEHHVTCGEGQDVGGLVTVYAAENGVEACNDSGDLPQGRIILTSDQGGYAAADGDPSNGAEGPDGWIRIDSDGTVSSCDGDGDSTAKSCEGLPLF